jgi:uncharacterized phiE125 gp8 family phage protein
MSTIKVTDATSEPLSLGEAKAHLKETLVDAANDAYIEALMKVARTEAENRLQRSLLETTWLLTIDAFPDVIELRRPPILGVDWIKYLDTSGSVQTLGSSNYQVRTTEQPGEVIPAYGKSWPDTLCHPGAVQVQYRAGYAEAAQVPVPIVQWIKLAIADLYEARSRSAEKPRVPQTFADALLEPYRIWSL